MKNIPNPFEEILIRLESIEQKLSQEKPTPEPQKERFLSRNETCELLRISKPTLHSWMRQGKLKSYHIGGRTLFKEDEILATVEPVNFSIK